MSALTIRNSSLICSVAQGAIKLNATSSTKKMKSKQIALMYGSTASTRATERPRLSDPEIMQRCDMIFSLLPRKMERIKQLTECINSPHDSAAVREELKSERGQCTQMVSDLNVLLGEMSDQAAKANLIQQFAPLSETLKVSVMASLQKERNYPVSSSGVFQPTGDVRDYSSAQRQILLDKEIHLIERTQLDVDNKIITENNQNLHELKQGLAYTLEIQKDVDNLVDAQTELFSVAEQRTHHISTIVGAGTREIAIAGKKATSTRLKYCCILIVILGGLIICLAIIAARLSVYAAAA